MKYRVMFRRNKYGQSIAERVVEFEAPSDEAAITKAQSMNRTIVHITRIWGDEEEHWEVIHHGPPLVWP